MGVPLRIDFVSDVACPWCVIGLRSLMKAIEAVGDKVDADIHFQPFELNPDMPAEGENTFEHVQKKYGSTQEKSAVARQAMKESGDALGFTFNYGPQSRIWNTFDAHRLLHWAAREGKQLELKEALFKANFTDQLSTSDHEVLIGAAKAAGLDALLDDRDERPGVKFKDADLVGIPFRITVGKKLGEGLLEFNVRRTKEKKDVAVGDAIAAVKSALASS